MSYYNRRTVFKILLLLILFLSASISRMPGAVPPEEMEVPVDGQVPLFLKILTFDRNFKKRVGDEIVIGIVYQEKYRTSLNVKNRFEDHLKKLPGHTIEAIPFRCVAIPLITLAEFKTTLVKEKVDIIYVAPVRAIDVEALASISRSLGITSLTGVPRYSEAGIALGIGSKGDTPLIIINLPHAVSEGADFSSQLLKLAKVINNKEK